MRELSGRLLLLLGGIAAIVFLLELALRFLPVQNGPNADLSGDDPAVWFEPELKFLWALLVLVLVLLVRPQGILGTRERVG